MAEKIAAEPKGGLRVWMKDTTIAFSTHGTLSAQMPKPVPAQRLAREMPNTGGFHAYPPLKVVQKKRPRNTEAQKGKGFGSLPGKSARFATRATAAKAGDLRGFRAKMGAYPGVYKRPGRTFATLLPQNATKKRLFESFSVLRSLRKNTKKPRC